MTLAIRSSGQKIGLAGDDAMPSDPISHAGARMTHNLPVRILHVVDHPIHYFAQLYREIALHPEVDLRVLFWNWHGSRRQWMQSFGKVMKWDIPLVEGYNHEFLCANRTTVLGKVRRLDDHLKKDCCDVAWIHGYTPNYSLLTAFLSHERGLPLLLREEGNLVDSRPLWRRAAKRPILSWLCSWVYGIYIGSQNRSLYRHYGMSEDRLYPAHYCVNNAFFRDQYRQLRPRQTELRTNFGLPAHLPTILFAGKLESKKNPLLLVEAVAMIQRDHPCSVLFAGDGPLRDSVERQMKQVGIRHHAITGFLNQTEIGQAYAAADILVLPSAYKETWGMVVNEAMNFGLPIITTDRVGCAPDLVKPGENGFIVPSHDVNGLTDALTQMIVDSPRRKKFGDRSLEIIDHFSIERTAQGIIDAALAASGHKEEATS